MEYNARQKAAIKSTEPYICITAPPGSGKTQSIIGSIEYYCSTDSNKDKKIVVITYTRAAAAELKIKLIKYPYIHISTIHSWSLNEVNKLGCKYNFKVSILTDAQVGDLLLMISRQCGYFSLNQFYLKSYVTGNYNIDISEKEKAKCEAVYIKYIKYKRDNKLYDFTDLPLYLYDILVEYDESITDIDALFVDEFQDVDYTQSLIFDLVESKKKFVIGDEDQAIYFFRGATPEVMRNLIEKGYTSMLLEENYRSYQEIIDFSTAIRDTYDYNKSKISILDTQVIGSSWIKCVRGSSPSKCVFKTEEDSILLSALKKKAFILCRSNKQVKTLKDFGYENVSTVHQAKGLEYDDVIVVDFVLKSEEELNIAYVACTRAKNSLVVTTFMALINTIDYNTDIEFTNKLF